MILDYIIKLFLGGFLSGIIGIEREARAKEAGFRTHFLVGLGSSLLMIISKYGFLEYLNYENISIDPSRLAAQVISGIGFLGAGMIIFNNNIIKGLTTSAGIWTAAAIGLASGAGMYELSVISTIIVIICLEFVQFVCKGKTYKILKLEAYLRDRNIRDITNEVKLIDEKILLMSYKVLNENNENIFIGEFRIRGNEECCIKVFDIIAINIKDIISIEMECI